MHFDQPGNRITFEYVTKNVGRLRSPASHTLIKLEAVGAAHVVKLIAGRVRGLAPGEKSYGRWSATYNLSGDPLGAYTAWICADGFGQIAELNYHNNCKSVGLFFVVKKEWSGTVVGRGVLGQGPGTDIVYENWDSSDATFVFTGIEKGGIAQYVFQGTVSYDDTFGDPSGYCFYTGKYTFSTSNHTVFYAVLLLNYLKEHYGGRGWVDTGLYQIGKACPPPVMNYPGPEHSVFVDFAPFGNYKPLPFGTTVLKGIAEGTVSGYEEWVWHLE